MSDRADLCDRLDLSAEPSSVREARLFVIDRLQEWHCENLVDSAALVTSELATNAVLHTGKPYSVQVERNDAGVRVEVADHGHALPRMREVIDLRDDVPPDGDLGALPADPDRLFSGLRIVDSVAAEWGTLVVPGNGKVVWFELVDEVSGRPRERIADLRDLRDNGAPVSGSAGVGILGEEHDDDHHRGRHLAQADLLSDRYDGGRWGPGRWTLVVAVVAILVIGALLLFG